MNERKFVISTLKISALLLDRFSLNETVLILGLKSSNFSSEKYEAISGRNDTEYRRIFQQYCSLKTIENIYPEYMLLKNKLIYNIQPFFNFLIQMKNKKKLQPLYIFKIAAFFFNIVKQYF